MDNTDNIDLLISKFLAGEATPEEAMQLEDWKQQDVNHLEQFKQSQKVFNLINNQTTELVFDKEKAWQKINSNISYRGKVISISKNPRMFLGIAASFIFMIVAYFMIKNQMSKQSLQNYSFSANTTKKEFMLNDNTHVVLAPGSTLQYNENFGKGNRNVRLIGSGYFTVRHSKTLPFIVDLGKVYLQDLGTKFNIKLSADTDSIHIKVDEGVVLLFDSTSNSIEIKASERAIYVKSSKQVLKPTINDQSILNFEKTPLSKVIAQLEEKFATKIELNNPNLSKCTISAKFKEEDLFTILSVISETLGLTFKKQTDGFIINGKACN